MLAARWRIKRYLFASCQCSSHWVHYGTRHRWSSLITAAGNAHCPAVNFRMESAHHGYNDIYDGHGSVESQTHLKPPCQLKDLKDGSSTEACPFKACNVNPTLCPNHPSPLSSSKLKVFVSSPLLIPNGRTSQGQHLTLRLAYQLVACISAHRCNEGSQTHQRPAPRIKACISSSSRTRHQDGPKMKKWVGSKNCP